MKQSRKASLVESLLNIAVGFLIALVTQILVFPMFNIHVSGSDHLAITGIFTVVSVARSYSLRRLFEVVRVRGHLQGSDA